MTAKWLGQSGFLFHFEGCRILVDPFFSNVVEQKQGIKRLVSPPCDIVELKPDVIFITHDHLDHFDPVTLPELHKLNPEALIAGPESVMLHAHSLGFNPAVLVPMSKGVSKCFQAVKITATPAYHSDPYAVGCLIEAMGRLIYVSGDTLFNETLVEEVKKSMSVPLDLAFVVINGKLGNMNVFEAVELARQLDAKLAIPMHYGMFEANTADPLVFIHECHNVGINAQELTLGKATIL